MAPAEVWVISGASRGIGTELAIQLLQQTDSIVFATGRSFSKAKRLEELQSKNPKRLHLITMNVVDSSSIQAAKEKVTEIVGNNGVDYLINNAGTAGMATYNTHQEDIDTFRRVLETNVLGVHAVTQAFLPLLKASRKKLVINVSSCLGSQGYLATKPAAFETSVRVIGSYKTSKAALNMLTLCWAQDISAEQGVTFISLHPGVVTTDMGAAFIEQAKLHNEPIKAITLTPAQSVEAMLKVIAQVKPEDSGKYLDYNGEVLPY